MAETIQLLITCLVDTLYPDVGEAVVRVLRRAGVQVEFPRAQTCCGQPAYNAGLRSEARRLAEYTIRTFEDTPGAVVIPSGSCAAMIRHSYLELFADDPEWLPRARRLADRTFEFSEYLVDVLGISDLGARYNGLIGYHASCHLLRELGVNRQPLLLLNSLRSATVAEIPGAQECCGFGGVFSIEHPELSAAMLERKIQNIEHSQADIVVACDAGCISNINGGLHRRGLHPRLVHLATLLDDASAI
jgi:L-lactate dehydrogenase complex protein LldE